MGKVHQPEYGEEIVQHLVLYVATAAETTTSERCAEAEMMLKQPGMAQKVSMRMPYPTHYVRSRLRGVINMPP